MVYINVIELKFFFWNMQIIICAHILSSSSSWTSVLHSSLILWYLCTIYVVLYLYNKRLNNIVHLGYLLAVNRNQYIISSPFHESYVLARYSCYLHNIMYTIILVLFGTLIGVNADGDASINTITQYVVRSKLAILDFWGVCRRLELLLHNIMRRSRSTNLCFSLIFKPTVRRCEMEEKLLSAQYYWCLNLLVPIWFLIGNN